MTDADMPEFIREIEAVANLHGHRNFTEAVAARYWHALQAYDLATVLAAMAAHDADRERGKFMPKPADLLHQIERRRPNPRPGSDEAWAMLPFDESQSAVWTTEMAEAWGLASACLPDRNAARMAFRDAYNRLCQQAEDRREPLRWSVTLGTDKASRAQAIESAVAKGRISRDYANAMLPAPEIKPDATLRLLDESAASDEVRQAAMADLRKLLRRTA